MGYGWHRSNRIVPTLSECDLAGSRTCSPRDSKASSHIRRRRRRWPATGERPVRGSRRGCPSQGLVIQLPTSGALGACLGHEAGDSKGQQRYAADSCALVLTGGEGSEQRRSPGHAVHGMQEVRVNHRPAAKPPSSAWCTPGERPTGLQDQAAWRDHRGNNAACRSVGPDRELVSPLVAQHELAVPAGDVQHQPTGDSLALVQRQLIKVEERVTRPR